MRIFTIGHSNHTADVFLHLLEHHEVKTLVDVRRFPGSRKWPHFNRDALALLLDEHNISYQWMESLGGRRSRKDPDVAPFLDDATTAGLENDSFRAYAAYMQSDTFRKALDDLIEIAQSNRTATMCSEGPWWRCHRRLISDALIARGVEVQHIMTAADPKPHILTDVARIEEGSVTYPHPMFAAPSQE